MKHLVGAFLLAVLLPLGLSAKGEPVRLLEQLKIHQKL